MTEIYNEDYASSFVACRPESFVIASVFIQLAARENGVGGTNDVEGPTVSGPRVSLGVGCRSPPRTARSATHYFAAAISLNPINEEGTYHNA